MVDVHNTAQRFRKAEETGTPIAPITSDINHSLDIAYDIQEASVAAWTAAGRRQIGWKIGLTSEAARKQMQAVEPMFGTLFADMEILPETGFARAGLIKPRIEPEVAIVLKEDIATPKPTLVDILRSIDFVLPAFEVVDCRSRDWEISVTDAIADNALASGFVLGMRPLALNDYDFAKMDVSVDVNDIRAGDGIGANCMGHPFFAIQWLAGRLHERGRRLSRGELILTGSLCPMIKIEANHVVTARFAQTHDLTVHVK